MIDIFMSFITIIPNKNNTIDWVKHRIMSIFDQASLSNWTIRSFFASYNSSGNSISNFTIKSPLVSGFPLIGIPLPPSTLLVCGEMISSKCKLTN